MVLKTENKPTKNQNSSASSSLTSSRCIRSVTTCIVGGGNSAHVLIPFLSEAGHCVHLLTRRPEDWRDIIYCDVTDGVTGQVTKTYTGRIDQKSYHPEIVIPDADIIILCMPVHACRSALDNLAPLINRDKEVFVGNIFGQAGFNWMVHAMERQHDLTNIVTFSIGQIPWICRALEYGHSVANYGGKQVNTVAVTPTDKFDTLNDIFLMDISFRPLQMGLFRQACSFLSLTMSVDNQIIHPSRCYALYQTSNQGVWESEEDVPYFYRDFDALSADNIRKIDDEYSAIRAAIRKRFPGRDFKYMLSYLELENLNHSSGQSDILASFKESLQLASIKTPTFKDEVDGKYHLHVQCRFFTDDIPYGLLIAKWVAEELQVPTPFIDEIITWAQDLRSEMFLTKDGKINKDYCLSGKYTSGIPESYGVTSVDEILD